MPRPTLEYHSPSLGRIQASLRSPVITIRSRGAANAPRRAQGFLAPSGAAPFCNLPLHTTGKQLTWTPGWRQGLRAVLEASNCPKDVPAARFTGGTSRAV